MLRLGRSCSIYMIVTFKYFITDFLKCCLFFLQNVFVIKRNINPNIQKLKRIKLLMSTTLQPQ